MKEGGEQNKEVSENNQTYLWTLYVDRAARPNQSGARAILRGQTD